MRNNYVIIEIIRLHGALLILATMLDLEKLFVRVPFYPCKIPGTLKWVANKN